MMRKLVNLVLFFFVVLVVAGMASAAMTDPATGIAFAPRLQDEREIVGVGVEKEGSDLR
jgi:archaellum component FlaG (FlaF/FlaG flagellin family)